MLRCIPTAKTSLRVMNRRWPSVCPQKIFNVGPRLPCSFPSPCPALLLPVSSYCYGFLCFPFHSFSGLFSVWGLLCCALILFLLLLQLLSAAVVPVAAELCRTAALCRAVAVAVAYACHRSGGLLWPDQRNQQMPYNHKEISVWCLHNNKAKRSNTTQPDKACENTERGCGRDPTQETLGIMRGEGGAGVLDPHVQLKTHPLGPQVAL